MVKTAMLFISVGILMFFLYEMLHKWPYHKEKNEQMLSPFVVSEYLDRTERVGLEVLEQQKTIERTIILWWGLDGLRLNEDGTLEWISRKKQNIEENSQKGRFCIIPQGIFDSLAHEQGYIADMGVDIDNCPRQTVEFRRFFPYDMCQSQKAQLCELQFQMAQIAQNEKIISSL